MKHYIDKDALVTEIERIMNEQQEICKADVALGKAPDSKNIEVIYQFQQFTKFLDTLEVKAIGVDIGSPEGDYNSKTVQFIDADGNIKEITVNKAQNGKSALEAAQEEKVDNQNCVKPADKVEPKFHKGEWLCENEPNNYARFIQILEIVNVQGKGRYRISRDIHNDEDIVEVRFVEKYYHKFDIKDAKDGDILMANAPFIFNGNLEGGIGCPGAHCGINTLGKFQIPTNPKHWTGHTTTPATKEQRDTLMKAMADAGYTFDFEKKELKKIEQKPAWSEEDETKIKSIIALLKSPALCAMDGNKGIIDESIKYLKSIKDRVQPQHKEWSEEDEKIIKRIDSLLYSQCKIHGSEYEEIHNWFKSLRPQSQWKPSNEQMEVLLGEVNAWTKGCPKQIVLESLYNDLKKLKEK